MKRDLPIRRNASISFRKNIPSLGKHPPSSQPLRNPGCHTVSLRFGVVLISPAAAKILDDSSGTVEGKAALRSYFKRGLELYPNLYFELLDLMHGLSSIVLCYKNQKGTKTAEFMEFKNGQIIRVVANYSR